MRTATKAITILTGILLSLAAVGATAQAQDKTYVLKFNHVLGPKEPFNLAFLKWAKAVSQRTDGHLKIQVFHSAQLGVEEDIIEQIRQGANIGDNTDSARLGNYVPGIAILNGPYFAENLDDVAKLRKSPTINKWLDELANKYGIKVLSFNWVQGYRNFFTNKPIRTPEDLKGLRIRTPPAPIWQESIRALGAEPVAIAFTDIYPALQEKAVDGAELVFNNILAAKMYEVLKYGSETHHIMLVNFEIVSTKWFNSLPAAYQKILVEECDKAGGEVSKQILANEDVLKKELEKKGMIMVKGVDIAAFRKAGKNAYKALHLMDAYTTVSKEIGKM